MPSANFLLGFLKRPAKDSLNMKILSLPERFEMESKESGVQPFLYGEYSQKDLAEDFDVLPETTYRPFIMAMMPGKIKSAIQDINDGESADFEADVHEMSIIGYKKASANGVISDSAVNFIKKYNDGYGEPIEYEGNRSGTVYKGTWKFGKFNDGTFVLSFNKDVLEWKPGL